MWWAEYTVNWRTQIAGMVKKIRLKADFVKEISQ